MAIPDPSWSGFPRPLLSVVVPTKNEAGNIGVLVDRLQTALHGVFFEIIFADDSDDQTVATIEDVRARASIAIDLIHRALGERDGGLGGAVVAGLRRARGNWVCVMDCDLQHPPEVIPELYRQAERTSADLVVASRYSPHGSTGLGLLRSTASRGSTVAARMMFPRRLRNVTDPMSGFFLARKAAIDIDRLRPRGFKILLEILLRSPKMRVSEVGFNFGKRYAGESKASLHEGLNYLSQLWELRVGADSARFARFAAVGLTGLLVNTLLLVLATQVLGLFYLIGVALATQGSTLWNYHFTDYWVFSDRRRTEGRTPRFVMYFVMNNAALALRGPAVYVLTSQLGVHYLASNLVSLVALMILRFAVADAWIWGRADQRKPRRSSYSYDIHSVITVESDVRLPELARFLVDTCADVPTIRVQTGRLPKRAGAGTPKKENGSGPAGFAYRDGLGPLSFGIDVTMGETIQVVASSLLRHSPHVLYTNVVEPILRWTFVTKGYALVHGACLAFGGDAFLVTARTDTGKTTTILRILDQQRRSTDHGGFLSDDLTLVSPDGRALTYPKPLTISSHTVAAIQTPLLPRKARLGLFCQSRIHSRGGRRFAFLLSNRRLPVATINTITQFLVPPPKFHVQQLVPRVKHVREAKLAGIFIIERGGEGEVQLSESEALEILFSNCEDAYGFPPYHTIERHLRHVDGVDLRPLEHAIVTQAFKGCQTLLLRSTRMDWSDRIAALVGAGGDRIDAAQTITWTVPEAPAVWPMSANSGQGLDVP